MLNGGSAKARSTQDSGSPASNRRQSPVRISSRGCMGLAYRSAAQPKGVIPDASPQRQARTSRNVGERALVLAWRCGLAAFSPSPSNWMDQGLRLRKGPFPSYPDSRGSTSQPTMKEIHMPPLSAPFNLHGWIEEHRD